MTKCTPNQLKHFIQHIIYALFTDKTGRIPEIYPTKIANIECLLKSPFNEQISITKCTYNQLGKLAHTKSLIYSPVKS